MIVYKVTLKNAPKLHSFAFELSELKGEHQVQIDHTKNEYQIHIDYISDHLKEAQSEKETLVSRHQAEFALLERRLWEHTKERDDFKNNLDTLSEKNSLELARLKANLTASFDATLDHKNMNLRNKSTISVVS